MLLDRTNNNRYEPKWIFYRLDNEIHCTFHPRTKRWRCWLKRRVLVKRLINDAPLTIFLHSFCCIIHTRTIKTSSKRLFFSLRFPDGSRALISEFFFVVFCDDCDTTIRPPLRTISSKLDNSFHIGANIRSGWSLLFQGSHAFLVANIIWCFGRVTHSSSLLDFPLLQQSWRRVFTL